MVPAGCCVRRQIEKCTRLIPVQFPSAFGGVQSRRTRMTNQRDKKGPSVLARARETDGRDARGRRVEGEEKDFFSSFILRSCFACPFSHRVSSLQKESTAHESMLYE